MEMTRRQWFRRTAWATLGVGGTLAGTAVYGTRWETEFLEITRVHIPLPPRLQDLAGLRLVWLSDLHLYPHTRLPYIERVAREAALLEPDLLFLGGDYVLDSAAAIYDLAGVLAQIPRGLGAFAVTGNHDIWQGRRIIEAELRRRDFRVLVNDAEPLRHNGVRFWVAGVDDCWSGEPNLGEALRRCPDGEPVVLLSHEPDPADRYSADSRIFLQLSGHSHGGQVRFPGIGSPFLPPFGRKYPMGFYRVGGMYLYTNRGIGVTAPIRLNCRPELTLFELVAAEEPPGYGDTLGRGTP
ncbi:MAG: metallophosphoesterase [Acidobacteriota bacterium]